MSDYIQYMTNIALSFWDSILNRIGETFPAYTAYVFCLLSVLIALTFGFALSLSLFRFLYHLLGRSSR